MPTIKDIAKLAGVSHGTVSNVLNKRGNVSSRKIMLVENAVQQLGYTVDSRASELRKGYGQTLALVLPTMFDRQYAEFYTSFRTYASTMNYGTSVFFTSNDPQCEAALLQSIRESMPAAIAALTSYDGPDNIYQKAGFEKNRTLYVGHRPDDGCPSICYDACAAGEAMAAKATQYRNIALITDRIVMCDDEFCASFLRRAAKNPDCVVHSYIKESTERSYALAFQALSENTELDAVFVTNFGMAQVVQRVMEEFFNNQTIDLYTLSPIHTLPERRFIKYELNYRLLGKEAARMLVDMAEGKAPLSTLNRLPNVGFRNWQPASIAIRKDEPLVLATLDSPTAHAMSNLSRLYTQQTGTKVNIDIRSYDGVFEMLNHLKPENAPDIIRLDMTWMSWFAKRIFEPLENIDPTIRQSLGNFLPNTLDLYAYLDGVLYALPETPSVQMLFYRRSLFESPVMQRLYQEKYHQQLQPPTNFDEFNRIARFFTRRFHPASPVTYGTTLTLGNTGVVATEFLTRYFSLTNSLYDHQDHLLLDTPQALAALKLMLGVQPCVQPAYSSWWRETAKSFAMGDTAMTILFSNYASEINGLSSKLASDVGAALVPGGNPLMGGGSIGVCRYSRRKQEALNFIRWFCSEEVSSAMTYLGSVSPCQATYDNYQIIDLYPWLALTRESMAASHVNRWPRHMENGFDERRFLDIMGQQIMNAVDGSITPETALKNIMENISKRSDFRQLS